MMDETVAAGRVASPSPPPHNVAGMKRGGPFTLFRQHCGEGLGEGPLP
jgi:hypothetical protein